MNKTELKDNSMTEDMLEELVGEQKEPAEVRQLDFTKLGRGHPKLNVDRYYREIGWLGVVPESRGTQCLLQHDLSDRRFVSPSPAHQTQSL